MFTRPHVDEGPYVGYDRYSVSTGTSLARRVFIEGAVVQAVLEQLLLASRLYEMAVLAYCFMPDRLHLLVVGQSRRADLATFVDAFKQRSGYSYRREHGQRLWEPGHRDRRLAHDESTGEVVRYLLEHPVRDGLAAEIGEYPFAGSSVIAYS